MAKTIVFCATEDAAERMRVALVNQNSDMVQKNPDYVVRITGSDTYGKSKALVALDYVLTGRFSLAYRMFDYVDWSLFGTNIQAEQLPFSLDNSLWYVILMQGIILFLLLTILYCWSVWKFGIEKRYLEANIILAFTLYSICENMYSALFLNLGLILACYYLNNEVKQYG
jgi:hypothetical protein